MLKVLRESINANKEPLFLLQFSDVTKPDLHCSCKNSLIGCKYICSVFQHFAMCLLELSPKTFYIRPSLLHCKPGDNGKSDHFKITAHLSCTSHTKHKSCRHVISYWFTMEMENITTQEREEMVCDVILYMHVCHLYGKKPNRFLPMLDIINHHNCWGITLR